MAEFEPDLAVDSESSETFDSELDSEVDSLSFHALDDISEPPLSNLFSPPSSVSPGSALAPFNVQDSRYIDITLRAIALSLFQTLPGTNEEKYKEVEEKDGVKKDALRKIRKKAKGCGYNFDTDGLRILFHHLVDKARSGRSRTACNPETEKQVIEIVTKDRNGREKSAEIIVSEMVPPISRQSVCRIMKKLGFKKVKKTTKLGLNDAQKANRLVFCCKYQYWTLEDWKKVIWSDETSVVIGVRRGSYKIWRRSDESVI